jgi:hypothetical protein
MLLCTQGSSVEDLQAVVAAARELSTAQRVVAGFLNRMAQPPVTLLFNASSFHRCRVPLLCECLTSWRNVSSVGISRAPKQALDNKTVVCHAVMTAV